MKEKRVALFTVNSDKLATGVFEATWKTAGTINLDFGSLITGWREMDDFDKAAVINGISQKLRDAAAASKESPESERFGEMLAVRDSLAARDWNRKRGESVHGLETFMQAFAEHRGMELADARELVNDVIDRNHAKTPERKRGDVAKDVIAAITAAKPDLVNIIARLNAEKVRVNPTIDVSLVG